MRQVDQLRFLNPFTSQAGKEIARRYGEELLAEFISPRRSFGAHIGRAFGPIGTGKTALLLLLTRAFLLKGWTVIWRGRPYFELYRMSRKWRKLVRIWVPEGSEIKFVVEPHRKKVEVEYNTYIDEYDLLMQIRESGRGKVHWVWPSPVPEIPTWLEETGRAEEANTEAVFWYNVTRYARTYLAKTGTAMFFDEAKELWPMSAPNPDWHINRRQSSVLADFRKAEIAAVIASHNYTDIDANVRGICDFTFWMGGARVPKHYDGLVDPKVVRHAPAGTAFIEYRKFGIINVPLEKFDDRGESWIAVVRAKRD